MNEAGSKGTGTLALRGQPVVVLKEGHVATRTRWTMSTMCISDFDDANTHGGGGIQGDEAAPTVVGMLPPLELMFKAQGCQLEHKLQASIPADASMKECQLAVKSFSPSSLGDGHPCALNIS